MTFNEFETKLIALGCTVQEFVDCHWVMTPKRQLVSKFRANAVEIGKGHQNHVPNEVFDVIIEFARTPIEEREYPNS